MGFDAEAGIYFVAGTDFQHLTFEAKSLDTLRKKLETLELRPVLSPVFAKDAPEFRKATKPTEEVDRLCEAVSTRLKENQQGDD